MSVQLTLLRQREVTKRCGLPRASLYAQISKGQFPKPIPLTQRSVAWLSTEVDAWIEARIAAALGGAK
jgi:prophage regulatory protein